MFLQNWKLDSSFLPPGPPGEQLKPKKVYDENVIFEEKIFYHICKSSIVPVAVDQKQFSESFEPRNRKISFSLIENM